jgi:glycosyltransferase involved in cell wall biosynthesis
MSKVIEMEQSEDGTVEMKKEEEADPGFTVQDKRKIDIQPPPPPLQSQPEPPKQIEPKKVGEGKKAKICIVTNFMEFNPRYSLTGIVKDHIQALTKNGHKVGLLVNEKYRDQDFEGVEMLKVLPFAHLKDYHNANDLTDDHKVTIDKTEQVLKKVFTDTDEDGDVYELAFCHDINFQGWFLPYKIGLEKASFQLPHVRWLHWVHSIPSGMREYWAIPSKKHKIIFPNETDRLRVAEQFRGEVDDIRIIHHVKDMRTFMGFDEIVCRMIDHYDLMSASVIQVYPASVDRLQAKGVDHVMKIFANLKKQGEDVRLIILNQWCNIDKHRNTVEQYCQTAKGLGLEPDKEVIFSSRFEPPRFETGVDANIVKDLFSLSNLFIFPTREEAFGLVLPEAALSGGVLLVLNRSLQMQSEVAGLNAVYFDFGSFTHNFAIPGDKYYEDIATIVRGRMRQEYSLMAKTFMRRMYNMDRIYKEEMLPIIGESRNW